MTAPEPSHRRGKVVDDKIFSAVIDEISNARTLKIRVDAVAERAGVNKTTIYRRYPERDSLVLAATLAHAADVVPIPDTGEFEQDLRLLVDMVREVVMSPMGQALLSASADSPEFVELRQQYWAARFTAAAQILDRAIGRGECRPGVDAELLLEIMVAPIHFRATQTGGRIDDAFVGEQVARLLAATSV